MHDRRIDGTAYTFGNQGALYMRAMVWYDHETQSMWSQPWGQAIAGSLKGVQLYLLPSQVTTWISWEQEHPETRVLINDVERLGSRRQVFSPDFVIGLILAGHAKAYYYKDAAALQVINDALGDIPILVWAGDDNFHAYVRRAGGQTLTFRAAGEALIDEETGSRWSVARGLAAEGPLKGEALQPVPGMTSYDSSWRDFYPDSEFFVP